MTAQEPLIGHVVPSSDDDALFLVHALEDNEHWNHDGITDRDLAVLFETSALCGYGYSRLLPDERPFSAQRFKVALRQARQSPKITMRGDRWYRWDSPRLRGAANDDGIRLCTRNGCQVEVVRANALYCSKRCRDRDYRYGPGTGRVLPENARNKPCWDRVPDRSFSGVGYSASFPDLRNAEAAGR